MAHEITNTQGRHEFAYVGESPWHHLGQRLPAAATAEEIMAAAGLNWVVLSEGLHLADGTPVSGYKAQVRSDSREVLGIVSSDYRTFQNGDALGFLNTVVGQAEAVYHTAGSIRKGRKVFACAKLPQSIFVTPQDVVEQYLLLVNNHDGDGGLHLRFTPVRVVCANTLGAAIAGAGTYQYSIRHMGDLDANVKAARAALGVGARYFEAAGRVYKALSAKEITATMLQGFVEGFLPLPTSDVDSGEAAQRERERILIARTQVGQLFETGLGTDLPGVHGTAWAAVNAGVEWIERVRTAKQDGAFRSGAAEAAIFGVGQELRDRAFRAGLALLK